MRIMLDTNVILSALLFPGKQMDIMLSEITLHHTLVLSSFVVEELHEVTRRKFSSKCDVVDTLLAKMGYELVYTPQHIEMGKFEIRDDKDYPVLYTAIMEDIDILITGDKDFVDVEVEKPEILTPAGFVQKYC